MDDLRPEHEHGSSSDEGDCEFLVDEDGFESLSESESDINHEDGFESLSDDEHDPPIKSALKKLNVKMKRRSGDGCVCPFFVGQIIGTKDEIRTLVDSYATMTRRQLHVLKNDKQRFRVVCFGKKIANGDTHELQSSKVQGSSSKKTTTKQQICPWVLYCSRKDEKDAYVVKTLIDQHLCLQTRDVNLYTISRIARDVEPIIKCNPTIPLKALQDMLQKKYQLEISSHQIFRAKQKATKKMQGDFVEQYARLREYCDELIRTNPDRAKSDILLNNLCEVFNRQLIEARDKPIITCLEYIREYLMKRIVVVLNKIAKSCGILTPVVTKIFDAIKNEASQYTVIMAGGDKYQVTGPWSDQCIVDMGDKSCSCRKWELTGIPCKHAVATIWDMSVNGMEVGVPETWVSEVYWLKTWKTVYMNTISPINGPENWIPSTCPTKLIPPKHRVQTGSPKKKRRKSQDELLCNTSKDEKLTREGHSKRCSKCKMFGHNSRTCTRHGGTQSSQNVSQSAPSTSQDK